MTLLSRIKIFLLWTVFAIKFDKKTVGPDIIELDGYLFARWYSPVFWVWAAFMFPRFLLSGGLIRWLDWLVQQVNQATWNRHVKYQWDKPTLSKKDQNAIVLIRMYLDRKYL